ncbi:MULTISPECIES: recombination regulator RecX [unclassified Streptomyces]|uniref:recombination regulator RecX n=1 Tax=unclassified Streptomyces TaxID=2593676 RepID=UPI00224F597B|nr:MULTISPECIES: recombination regulator RecX [unclassified Streptomyces]MCX4407517.1 recombination regulator RecX [Streptomyces sp. NBC_01764]MCX5187768.1 recombination regulator RecX [Streptomyces sp. NBC_00268]
MTRRTDWAEYAYPVPPRGQGHGGNGDSAGDGERAHGGDGPYGDETYGASSTYSGDTYGSEGFHGGDPYGSDGPAGDGDGDGLTGGLGSPGSGSRRGGGRRGDGGPRGGRGRRRHGGFGDPSDDPQDGGTPSSSRAEKGEPPGDPAERARAICLRLLTGTPRTRKQLADALRKREIPDDVADEVLSRFEEVGLINDSAFADAWVESRHHGRGLARRALARELRTKGVDSTLIDEAVGQLDSEQEEATARELVARKLRSTRGLDRDKRLRRLAGMLARKGYGEGMALRVVRQALEEEGEDTEGLGDEGF